mmetsp:Transcript_35029/g.34044  ORF Transcript_35029/g.34044 Transcript_35029/m.34044 type:complete len:94 (+) Transcript_35029:79-360(+)
MVYDISGDPHVHLVLVLLEPPLLLIPVLIVKSVILGLILICLDHIRKCSSVVSGVAWVLPPLADDPFTSLIPLPFALTPFLPTLHVAMRLMLE